MVDSERMAVSLTTTLEQGYGSRIVVPGAGLLLNNEMGDFNARRGLTTREGLIGTEANLAAPHTRHSWRREEALFDVQDLDPGPIPVPVLVIHGQDDRLAPPAIGEWILAHTRDSRILRVEGGSHMLPITHPDLLADRIERFVRRGE